MLINFSVNISACLSVIGSCLGAFHVLFFIPKQNSSSRASAAVRVVTVFVFPNISPANCVLINLGFDIWQIYVILSYGLG